MNRLPGEQDVGQASFSISAGNFSISIAKALIQLCIYRAYLRLLAYAKYYFLRVRLVYSKFQLFKNFIYL